MLYQAIIVDDKKLFYQGRLLSSLICLNIFRVLEKRETFALMRNYMENSEGGVKNIIPEVASYQKKVA